MRSSLLSHNLLQGSCMLDQGSLKLVETAHHRNRRLLVTHCTSNLLQHLSLCFMLAHQSIKSSTVTVEHGLKFVYT
uniref:Uncharacterized protein n=1 Tax=Arundo donax TaxID=35708 RepID=A0A0A8Y4X1_ARUDO